MISDYSSRRNFPERDSQNIEAISANTNSSRLYLIGTNGKVVYAEDVYHNQFEINFSQGEGYYLILKKIKDESRLQMIISNRYAYKDGNQLQTLFIKGYAAGCFSNLKEKKIVLLQNSLVLFPFSFENFQGEVFILTDNNQDEQIVKYLPIIFYHSKGTIYLNQGNILLGLEKNTIVEKEGSYFIRDQEVEVISIEKNPLDAKKIQTERVFFASEKEYCSKDGTRYYIEEGSVSLVEIPAITQLILTEQCKVLLEDETSHLITQLSGIESCILPFIPSNIQQISNLKNIPEEVDITSCTLTETFFGENCFLKSIGTLLVTSTQKTQMENWNLIEMKTPESGDPYPIFVGSGDMKIQVKEGN